MQLALRHRYGFAGLGDDAGFSVITNTDPVPLVASTNPSTLDLPSPNSGLTLAQQLQLCAGDPNCVMPGAPTPTPSTLPSTLPGLSLCPDGSAPFSDGSCVETSAASGSAGAIAAAAQISAALARAITPTVSSAGVPSCPAGYVYGAPGQSIQLAPGLATVGAGKCLPIASAGGQVIPGVSNATLGWAVVAIVVIAMIASRR